MKVRLILLVTVALMVMAVGRPDIPFHDQPMKPFGEDGGVTAVPGPRTLPDLVFYWRADTLTLNDADALAGDGDMVKTLPNIMGGNLNFAQGTGSNQGALVTGAPDGVAVQTGLDDYYLSQDGAGSYVYTSKEMTFVIINRPTSYTTTSASYNMFFGSANPGFYMSVYSPATDRQYPLFRNYSGTYTLGANRVYPNESHWWAYTMGESDTSRGYIDGVYEMAFGDGEYNQSTAQHSLCKHSASYAPEYLYAVMIYNHHLNATEIARLDKWVEYYYGF